MSPERIANYVVCYSAPEIAERMLDVLTQMDSEDPDPQVPALAELLQDPAEVDRLAAALDYLEALAVMTAQQIARQQARQRAIEEAKRSLERSILAEMSMQQIASAQGQFCTLRKRLNPVAVRITDPALVPDSYMRQQPPPPPLPDKPAIKAAIEAGQFVPGASLGRGERLVRQ